MHCGRGIVMTKVATLVLAVIINDHQFGSCALTNKSTNILHATKYKYMKVKTCRQTYLHDMKQFGARQQNLCKQDQSLTDQSAHVLAPMATSSKLT